MKIKLIGLILLLTLLKQSSAQSPEIVVTLVSCKAGTLYINGEPIGPIAENDALRKSLREGEHFFQVKTDTENFFTSISLVPNFNSIIRIGCGEDSTLAPIQPVQQRLVDKQIKLPSANIDDSHLNLIHLDAGDVIVLSSIIKNGNASLIISNYDKSTVIDKIERFETITEEKIDIPSKGIYSFTLYSDAHAGKEAQLTIDRIPSTESPIDFNTNVRTVYDTSHIEVLNEVKRVHALSNWDYPNRMIVRINLPYNAVYWTYWIGVGRQAQIEMKKLLSLGNPLVLYGMKRMESLPMLAGSSDISYKFMNSENAALFINEYPYEHYPIRHGDKMLTDYSTVNQNGDIVLALSNTNETINQDVEIRVVAFTIRKRYLPF